MEVADCGCQPVSQQPRFQVVTSPMVACKFAARVSEEAMAPPMMAPQSKWAFRAIDRTTRIVLYTRNLGIAGREWTT